MIFNSCNTVQAVMTDNYFLQFNLVLVPPEINSPRHQYHVFLSISKFHHFKFSVKDVSRQITSTEFWYQNDCPTLRYECRVEVPGRRHTTWTPLAQETPLINQIPNWSTFSIKFYASDGVVASNSYVPNNFMPATFPTSQTIIVNPSTRLMRL